MGDIGESGETGIGESFAGEEPKKKPKAFVHWSRPRSQLYEYNYDYGANYYRPMIDYLDQRAKGSRVEIPKPQLWEERALKSYMDRVRRSQSLKITRDAALLQQLRNSSSHYIAHSKTYARKITASYF